MKLYFSSSFTALTLSMLASNNDARNYWNNGYANDPNSMSEPMPNYSSDPIDWNSKTREVYSPGRVYSKKLQAFKRPDQNLPTLLALPEDTQNPAGFSGFSEEFYNAYKTASRPSKVVINQNTSKVKVRVTIQFNCRHLPTISSVQNRVNKDHLIRSLITKQFSAVHVNRFSCNTPTELYADFVFYVYDSDRNNFEKTLMSLKSSLCRAVGVHHTEMAKTIRILPEKEIIDEAVNQVSSSISKAIAAIGKDDVSDIVDVAVNNIIQLDNTSVNNIIDDLVKVINVDREEVVNEVVSKVENQIKVNIKEATYTSAGDSTSVKLIAEAIADETANILGSMLEHGKGLYSVVTPLGEPSLDLNTNEDSILSASEQSFNENIEESDNVSQLITDADVQELIDSINLDLEHLENNPEDSVIEVEKDMDEDSLNLNIFTEEEEDNTNISSMEGSLADFMPLGFETADDDALNNFIKEIEGEQGSNLFETHQEEENDLKMVLFETEVEPEEPSAPEPVFSAKDIATEVVIIPSEATIESFKFEEAEEEQKPNLINRDNTLYEEVQATEMAKNEFKEILIEATKMPVVDAEVDHIATVSTDPIRDPDTETLALEDTDFDQNQADLELDFDTFDIEDVTEDDVEDDSSSANFTLVKSDEIDELDDVVSSILNIDDILDDLTENRSDPDQEDQTSTSKVEIETEVNNKLPEIMNTEIFEDVEEGNDDSIPSDTFEELNNINFTENEVNEAILTLLESEIELTDVVSEDKSSDDNIENVVNTPDVDLGLSLNPPTSLNKTTTILSNNTNSSGNSTSTINLDNLDNNQNDLPNQINKILVDAMSIDNIVPDELINRVSLANLANKNRAVNKIEDNRRDLDDISGQDHGIMEGIVEAALGLFS